MTKTTSFNDSGALGFSIFCGPIGRIYVASVDGLSEQKSELLKSIKIGDVITSVNDIPVTKVALVPDEENLLRAHKVLTSAKTPRTIICERCNVSIDSLQPKLSRSHFIALYKSMIVKLERSYSLWSGKRTTNNGTSRTTIAATKLRYARLLIKTNGYIKMESMEMILSILADSNWVRFSETGKSAKIILTGMHSYADRFALTAMLLAKHVMTNKLNPENSVVHELLIWLFLASESTDQMKEEVLLWCCYFKAKGRSSSFGDLLLQVAFTEKSFDENVYDLVTKIIKMHSLTNSDKPEICFTRVLVRYVINVFFVFADKVHRLTHRWIMLIVKYFLIPNVKTKRKELPNEIASMCVKLLTTMRMAHIQAQHVNIGLHDHTSTYEEPVRELFLKKFNMKCLASSHPALFYNMKLTNFYMKICSGSVCSKVNLAFREFKEKL